MVDQGIAKLVADRGGKTRALGNGAVACEVAGEEAVQLWRDLLAAQSVTGLYPLIVGNITNLASFDKEWAIQGSGEAAEVSIPEWVEERFKEMREDLEGDDESWQVPPRGKWPEQSNHSKDFDSVMNTAGTRYLGFVGLILVPASRPWDIPFVLKFGGWNECPGPEVHASFIRYWNERYGALPVALTGDVFEMAVDSPPTEPQAAIRLAIEQYAYCSDIVDQGTETIEGLAAEILGQRRWFFWWD